MTFSPFLVRDGDWGSLPSCGRGRNGPEDHSAAEPTPVSGRTSPYPPSQVADAAGVGHVIKDMPSARDQLQPLRVAPYFGFSGMQIGVSCGVSTSRLPCLATMSKATGGSQR